MSSAVDIANRALQKVGVAKRISDFNDPSQEAQAINNCYESLRDAELQKNVWVFAVTRAELAADSDAPAWGRFFQYQLPENYLRRAPTTPQQSWREEDFLREGRKILSDAAAPLQLRYVRSDVIPEQYDPQFIEALAARIAIEIVEELTQSNTKKDSLEASYLFHIQTARQMNSIEKTPTRAQRDTWETVRSDGTTNGDW
jgi:hypothetical protein